MYNNSKHEKQHTLSAHRTNDGFIEITSLELLDELVGGFINPEEVYCQVYNTDEKLTTPIGKEGIS
jgi:hypothetical protein